MFDLIAPIFTIIFIFLAFIILIWRKLKQNLFLELGVIYLTFIVLYTLAPGVGLLYAELSSDIKVGLLLDYLDANKSDLAYHLWRHCLFAFTFSASYYIFRLKKTIASSFLKESNRFIIYLLIILITISISSLFLLSAPVNGYLEHYIRYDHLPVFLRKVVSFLIRFKMGFYTILLVFLFSQFEKFKKLIFFIVPAICFLEIIYSYGSRIYSLIILLQCFFLYNYYVKTITIKFVIISSIILMTIYSAIEIIRLQDVNSNGISETLSENSVGIPAELGAVYVPSFQLYNDRKKNSLPSKEWQMFFYDFISPFTFNSDTKWNPMWWYGLNYFPQSDVPPFTIGPIAESAIWGGEFDLFLRGIINGIFFSFIVNWFIKRKDKFWAVTIYVYCFSFSILTIKYSIFFYLTPLVKELIPTIFITLFFLITFRKQNHKIMTPNFSFKNKSNNNT
jgi:hypothetical protein